MKKEYYQDRSTSELMILGLPRLQRGMEEMEANHRVHDFPNDHFPNDQKEMMKRVRSRDRNHL